MPRFFLTMQRKILWPYHNFLAHRRLNFWPCRDFFDHAACFFFTMPRHSFRLDLFFFRTCHDLCFTSSTCFSNMLWICFNHAARPCRVLCFDYATINFSTMPRVKFQHATNLFTLPCLVFRICIKIFFDHDAFLFSIMLRLNFWQSTTYFSTQPQDIVRLCRLYLVFLTMSRFFSTLSWLIFLTMLRYIFRLDLFFFEHATTYFSLTQLVFRACYEFVLTMPRLNFVHATCYVSTTPRSFFRPCQELSSNLPRPIFSQCRFSFFEYASN